MSQGSLTEIESKNGPKQDPGGTPDVTNMCVDTDSFITLH